MNTENLPITDAVYGKKGRGGKPGKKAPVTPRSTVAGALGRDGVDSLYRALGFRKPQPKPRKGGRR